MSGRAIGWQRVGTHLGQTRAGSRSTSWRMISKRAPPAPRTMGRPQLDGVGAVPEDAPHLVAGAEMLRDRAGAEATEVDHPGARGRRRGCKTGGRITVAGGELCRFHRVDEVVGDIAPLERTGQS